jgi:hypothetical protein
VSFDILGYLPEKLSVPVASYDAVVAISAEEATDFHTYMVVVDCQLSLILFRRLTTDSASAPLFL